MDGKLHIFRKVHGGAKREPLTKESIVKFELKLHKEL